MSLGHLGQHTFYLKEARNAYARSVELTGCAPPVQIDPRTHLNGPFVSLRKVQKQHELCRLSTLESRRAKLRKLIECDRQQYQCELLQQVPLTSNRAFPVGRLFLIMLERRKEDDGEKRRRKLRLSCLPSEYDVSKDDWSVPRVTV
ncbi:unnamed protein product [Allacma fusca]|uniref:Uncharacterized protein n=1 Tax=Allacma fusca TaxID=39272 RepID=A0A8J2KHR6_9HEXA|nr:unnamed protein product [Allacma fusca]